MQKRKCAKLSKKRKKPFTNDCGMFAKEKSTTLYVKKNLCVIGQKRTLFKLLYQKQNPTKKNNYVCVDLCHTISTTTIFLPEN